MQSGKITFVNDRPNNYGTGFAKILKQNFRTLAGVLSNPVTLLSSRICNKLKASVWVQSKDKNVLVYLLDLCHFYSFMFSSSY